MMRAFRSWVCPNCATRMNDEIDPEFGPFNTCVCDYCGLTVDKYAIPYKESYEEVPQ